MISRKHRFHGYNSLRYIYRHGSSVRVGSCVLRYIKNERRPARPRTTGGPNFRMAVVVSKKVSKKAVVRNRIRRRIFEAVRLHASAIVPHYDFMFSIFSDEFADMPSEELSDIIGSCLRQAGMLNADTRHGQRQVKRAKVEGIKE